MPYAQYAHQIERGIESVKGDVAARAVGNNELPYLRANTPADPWVLSEHLHRTADAPQGDGRRAWRCIEQKLHYAFEILERRFGVNYSRHRAALGRRALRPFAFASR